MTPRNILHSLFSFLEVRSTIGGLEISDTALRFVASGSSFATSIRIAPGIVMAGRVQDEAAFSVALAALRKNILGRKASGPARISAVVVLSSAHVYSQVFALPLLKGADLERAVDLNLKMAVPGGVEGSYAGWQVLAEDPSSGKVEILSAFLEKSIADELTNLLRKENFSVLAIESRALALARLTRRESSNIDPRVPALVISADAEGLDTLIIRGGNLQFDYFHSWNDLKGEAKSIALEDFRGMVTRSVNQILNFYNGHWKEPIGKILVGATGMQEEIIGAIKASFEIPVSPLSPVVSPPITPEWFTAFGSALRGQIPRQSDKEVSLLGIDAQEEYRREEITHFLNFWRLLVPVSLITLFAILGGSFLFLRHIHSSVAAQAVLHLDPVQTMEINALKADAQAFNSQVESLAAINASAQPKTPLIAKLTEILERRGISLNKLVLGSAADPIMLSASAKSEQDIVDFKKELTLTPGIKNVTLPFTDIKKQGDIYTFAITFLASSP